MKSLSRKLSILGAVIEFRFQEFFVYGAVISEDKNHGDSLVMFAPKYQNQLTKIDDLYLASLRCKFVFPVRLVVSKANLDKVRFAGSIDVGRFSHIDRRYRVSLAGISEHGKWQILNGGARTVVDFLTTETASLSDADVPNLAYIQNYYEADHYPWSAALTTRGALDFDPVAFENMMRRDLSRI